MYHDLEGFPCSQACAEYQMATFKKIEKNLNHISKKSKIVGNMMIFGTSGGEVPDSDHFKEIWEQGLRVPVGFFPSWDKQIKTEE